MTDATYTSLNTPRNAGFGKRVGSFLKRVFADLAAAREREARRQVSYYLQDLDDKALDDLGFKRDEIKRWG